MESSFLTRAGGIICAAELVIATSVQIPTDVAICLSKSVNSHVLLAKIRTKQKSPQTALFHSGFVQLPRMDDPSGRDEFATDESVTTHMLFEKHVHPSGQHDVMYAVGSQAKYPAACTPFGR